MFHALTYVNRKQVQALEELVDLKNYDTDGQNYKIFYDVISNLNKFCSEFFDSINFNFNEFFDEMTEVHMNFDMTDKEKIDALLKISNKLVIFEKDVILNKAEKIRESHRLMIKNPKYDHIAKIYQDDM